MIVVGILRDINKRIVRRLGGRVAGGVPQEHDRLRAGADHVGREVVVARALRDACAHCPLDSVVVPGVLGHVVKDDGGLGLRERRCDDLTGRAAVLDGDGLDRCGRRERERAVGVERAVGRRVAAVGRVVDARTLGLAGDGDRLLAGKGTAVRVDDRSGRGAWPS